MKEKIKKVATNHTIIKTSIYVSFVSAVAGSAFLSVDVGSFNLFPYRIILPILWLFFLTGIILERKMPDFSHIKIKPYMWFMLIWFFYAALSVIWADSKIDAIRNIFLLFMGLSLIFFTVYNFSKLKDLKRYFHLWLIILAVLLGIGFLNIYAGYQLLEYESLLRYTRLDYLPDKSYWMHSPRATFVHPNDYASYIALTIPLILTFIRYSHSRARQLAGLALLFPALFQLVITGSRANLIAIVISLAFWFLVMLKPKERLALTALGGSAALAFIIKSPARLREELNNAVVKLAGLVTGSNIISDDQIRLNLIKNSFVFLVQHYGFGVGAGNAEYHMKKFRVYHTDQINNVHNWWVEILVNYGIFIFAGYIAFFFGILIALYKAYRKLEDSTEKMICEALLVGMVTFIPASMSPSSIMGFGPQWLFFAFALAFLNYYRLKEEREVE